MEVGGAVQCCAVQCRVYVWEALYRYKFKLILKIVQSVASLYDNQIRPQVAKYKVNATTHRVDQ